MDERIQKCVPGTEAWETLKDKVCQQICEAELELGVVMKFLRSCQFRLIPGSYAKRRSQEDSQERRSQ